jgi:hypothetical protein
MTNEPNYVAIDTNILYYWMGISKHPKLKPIRIEELSQKYNFYLSFIAIVELLLKYQNDFYTVQSCLRNLKTRHITIDPQPYIKEITERIILAEYELQVHDIFETIVLEKCSLEAGPLSVIFHLLFATFISANFGAEYSSLGVKDTSKRKFTVEFLEINKEFIRWVFANDLKKCYLQRNQQRQFKESFVRIFMLIFLCWQISLLSENMPENIEDILNIDEAEMDIHLLEINNPLSKKLTDYARHGDNPLAALKDKSVIKSIQNTFTKIRFSLKEQYPSVSEFEFTFEYLLFKLEELFLKKRKLQKNDAFDWFFVCNLDQEGFMILTLDRNIIDFLKKINHKNYDFIMQTIGDCVK